MKVIGFIDLQGASMVNYFMEQRLIVELGL